MILSAPNIDAKGYVLMDANSGEILASKAMNTRMEPASLTKLMTLYITAQELAAGRIHLNDTVRISDTAWRQTGSKMFLKEGDKVTVRDLISGVIVASGNDSCEALAEYIGGDEKSFAQLMNQAARNLGMKHSHFVDSTGLPTPDHFTTPYDMALLTRAIIKQYPQYYSWYKQKWITYDNIRQPNRNRLLWRDTSVDGLKTGHTNAAGYCLISSTTEMACDYCLSSWAPHPITIARLFLKHFSIGVTAFLKHISYSAKISLCPIHVFGMVKISTPTWASIKTTS